jgi:hypothetical protein
LLVFKKYKKIKKNQIYKKKVEGPILRSMQHFTYKYWSNTQTKGGGDNFGKHQKKIQKKDLTLNPFFSRRAAAPLSSFGGFHFSSCLATVPIFPL